MAKFPIPFAERVPPPVGPTVRATLDPRVHIPAAPPEVPTGEAEQWRAVAGLGAALAGVGEKFLAKFQVAAERVQDAEDAIAVSAGKREIDTFLLTGHQQSALAPDGPSAGAIQQESWKLVDATVAGGPNERVQNVLQMYRNNITASHNAKYATTELRIRKTNVWDKAFATYEGHLETGNEVEAGKAIALLITFNPERREELEQKIREIPVDSVLAQSAIMAGKDPDAALGMLSQLQEMTLTVDQAARRDQLVTHARIIKNRNKSQLAELRDKAEADLYERGWVKDELLTYDDFAAALPPKDAKRVHKEYAAYMKAKAEGRLEATAEGDPRVLVQTREMVDLNPELITPAQIHAMPGLGNKHKASLVTRLKTNLARVDPVAKKYRAELSKLRTAGFLGKKDELDTSKRFLELSDQLDAFLATKPPDADAQKFLYELIREDAKWFWMSPSTWVGAGPEDLPRWDDDKEEVIYRTSKGEDKKFMVRFGTIIEVDGKRLQAIGRSGGEVDWLDVTKGGQSAPHPVDNDADFEAVPSGAIYQTSDGRLWRKP